MSNKWEHYTKANKWGHYTKANKWGHYTKPNKRGHFIRFADFISKVFLAILNQPIWWNRI